MRRSQRHVIGCFALATTILPCASRAATDGKVIVPISAPSDRGNGVFLGPWIERKFQDMVRSCWPSSGGLKMSRIKRDKLVDVSAVPSSLRVALGLDNGGSKIEERDGRAVAYLFGNVYTSDEAKSLTVGGNTNYLATLARDTPDYLTMPRMNGAGYVQSCATTMSAALEANVGFTIPVGSLKAAFDADYVGKNGYSLNLVKATFKSPTLVAYNGGETSEQSPFNAAMTMFDWYRRHPERMKTANVLLENFEGVAIYQQAGFKRNTTIDASAAYKVGVPLIAASSGSAAIKADWVTDFNAQNFSVAIFRRDDATLVAQTVDLPDVADLVSRASQTGTVVVDNTRSGSDFTLYNRKARTIYYLINRLPEALCDGRWRLSAATLPSAVATLRMGMPRAQNDVDGWSTCSVPVTFQPAPAMNLDNAIDLAVTFELPLNGTKDAATVRLAAETVTMLSLDKPHLALIGNDVRPKTNGKTLVGANVRSSIGWSAKYQLSDEGAVVADGGINISRLNLACPGQPDGFVMPTREILIRSGSGNARLAELVLTADWNGDMEAPPAPLTWLACTLSGSVEYSLSSGPKVTKDFPALKFQYPILPAADRRTQN